MHNSHPRITSTHLVPSLVVMVKHGMMHFFASSGAAPFAVETFFVVVADAKADGAAGGGVFAV